MTGKFHDLGGFAVRRLLPSVARRSVGPFVFWDQMGPATLPAGRGVDVRPHPHIGLATITHLFEGEIVHRDSLGSAQAIRAGAVNWMTAGRGIVHSERTPTTRRSYPPRGRRAADARAADYAERAIHVGLGRITLAADTFDAGRLLVFRAGDAVTITADQPTRVLLFGGAPLDGPRHLSWNFVSSSETRIEQAKSDCKAARFPPVSGETERIPLPER